MPETVAGIVSLFSDVLKVLITVLPLDNFHSYESAFAIVFAVKVYEVPIQRVCGPVIVVDEGRWLTVTAKVELIPLPQPLIPFTDTVPETAFTP